MEKEFPPLVELIEVCWHLACTSWQGLQKSESPGSSCR
jgi:hypothetical protein